ncbi:MAG: Stp1/IreP family PP2C-type Ser/Thr phosphatase [Clostridiales bacterium]|nr:Stp1/IreP family PP2C-type Ser/Thr phosphatase [Clostridiales bacterium]
MEIGFKSDKGLRRKNNEDAFFVIPESNIFIIADGVGGNNAGEIASRTAISKIVEYARNNALKGSFSESEIKAYFFDCIEKVNMSIYNLSRIQPSNTGMATTVTIAYLAGSSAHIVNVGDSRAYHFREGSLIQITEDHSYVNSLVKRGAITKEEARFHEKKNVITRAIGGEASTVPDFFSVGVRLGDILLLCTDGIHGEIGDGSICGIMAAGGSMMEICTNLVNKGNRCGGRDNMTAICIKV